MWVSTVLVCALEFFKLVTLLLTGVLFVDVKTLERFPLVAGIRTLGVAFRRLMICLGSREDPPGVLTFVIFIGEAF